MMKKQTPMCKGYQSRNSSELEIQIKVLKKHLHIYVVHKKSML